MSDKGHLGIEAEHLWEGEPLSQEAEWEGIFNRQLVNIDRWNEQHRPRRMARRKRAALKWSTFKHRAARRWRGTRRAVALCIAPELEEDR